MRLAGFVLMVRTLAYKEKVNLQKRFEHMHLGHHGLIPHGIQCMWSKQAARLAKRTIRLAKQRYSASKALTIVGMTKPHVGDPPLLGMCSMCWTVW